MFKIRKQEPSPEKPVEPTSERAEVKKLEPEVQPVSEPKPEPKGVELNKANVKEAIARGKVMIKDGKSKGKRPADTTLTAAS